MKKNNKKEEMKRTILTTLLLIALSIVLIAVVVKPAQGLSIEPIQNYTLEEEQTLTFNIYTNENNGTVIFSKTPPQGTLTKVSNNLATFTWTPNIGDNGTYNFTFTAIDDINSATESNKIIVTKKNIPPTITNVLVGNQNNPQVQIDITTNTESTCKYSLSNKNYNQMEYTFSSKNTEKTEHTSKTPSLSQGSHTVYILCTDNKGNYMTAPSKTYLDINLKPSASISLNPKAPLKEGTIKVALTSSEDLLFAPDLKYSFDDESTLKNVALIGSGKNWEGYIIIKDTESERIGSFTFKGTDLTNLEGTEITDGKLFLIDTINPEAPQSLVIDNQNDRVKLTWNKLDSEEIAEYKIYRKVGSGGVELVDQYSSTTSTTFYDRDVNYNEAYYYRVSIVDEAGNEGPLSKEVFLTHAPVLDNQATETNTETINPSNNKKLDPKLEYILNLELQKIDKVLMDVNKAEETLSRSLGTDNIDVIDATKTSAILNTNKKTITELRASLDNLRNSAMSEMSFNEKVSELMTKADTTWKNTPIEISISDSASYQEFTNDEKTANIITSYLGEYYSTLSQKDTIKTIEEAKIFQDKVNINVKIIKGEIKYAEEVKKFSVIKKTFSSEEPLDKILLFESIPEKLGKVSKAEFSEQPFYKEDYAFWKFESLNNKKIYYVLYADSDMTDLKGVKSTIFDESKLLEQINNNLITGNVASNNESEREGGLLLSLIIAGVLIICGLFAYYVFWSETEDNETQKEKVEKEQNNSSHKRFDVTSTLFKKKRESIMPEDLHKKIEIEKPEEAIHTQTDSLEFKKVISSENTQNETYFNKLTNKSNLAEHKNFEELEKLQEKLEELKKTSKVDDLEDFDALRSKTYEIKRLCEEIEEQSVIEFSNKTRAHLEKSLLYIARNVPPEKKTRTETNTRVKETKSDLNLKEETPEEKQKMFNKNAPEWNEFILTTGERVKNIRELKEKLKEMPEETFTSHVSGEKNDFASWIRDVFQEYELAHKVRTAKTKEEIIRILE